MKRQTHCRGTYGVRHRLTEKTRRLKVYVKKDGSSTLVSAGCGACNSLGNQWRKRMQWLEIKLRKAGVAA